MNINSNNNSVESKNKGFWELVMLLSSINEDLLGIIGSYDGILDFKYNVINGDGTDSLKGINKTDLILNDTENDLVENYKKELYESAIYGTPVNESKIEKDLLILGEQLFNIVNKVDSILKI